MPPVEFEPTIPASKRPQTYALYGAATGTGRMVYITVLKFEDSALNLTAANMPQV